MMTFIRLRVGLILSGGLLLAGCEEKTTESERMYGVEFAQPFPIQSTDKASFPVRHQGVYTAADSVTSLCIGPTAVWQQQLRKETVSRQQSDSTQHHYHLAADSTYRDFEGKLHYLRLVGRDSVRDSWLWCDTIFALAGPNAGHLRKFQGRYYLNTPDENAAHWRVQRLEIAGHHLIWQTLGQDTLRLRALDTATVRPHRSQSFSFFLLRPAPGPQTRHVGDYAGLWETAGDFMRRR